MSFHPSEKHDFKISRQEMECLTEAIRGDSDLSRSVAQERDSDEDHVVVQLNATEAETLRDLLTERLATVGFDKDYVLTDEGRALEALIDKFFVR